MKKVKICVDQECLYRGRGGSPIECPVALAVRNVVKPVVKVDVGHSYLTLYFSSALFAGCFPFSERVSKIICDFDAGCTTVPFEFELDISDVYIKEQYR